MVPDGMTRAKGLLARTRPAPMEDTLGFALIEIAEGRAVFSGTPGANILNPMGIAHGGYAAALLDSACGIAVLTTLAETRAKMTAMNAEMLATGDDPSVVAQTILRAAKDASPNLRNPAGKAAKQISLLRRLVPSKLFDKSLRKQMGLPA